jgi:hypothetical protein
MMKESGRMLKKIQELHRAGVEIPDEDKLKLMKLMEGLKTGLNPPC